LGLTPGKEERRFWGAALQTNTILRQKPQYLTCIMAVAAMATLGLLLFAEPAFAEFQIQEAGIEKGEVEFQMGISDWWLIQVTGGFDQPLGENLQSSDVEIETESHC
jgi:hypothetical protein